MDKTIIQLLEAVMKQVEIKVISHLEMSERKVLQPTCISSTGETSGELDSALSVELTVFTVFSRTHRQELQVAV